MTCYNCVLSLTNYSTHTEATYWHRLTIHKYILTVEFSQVRMIIRHICNYKWTSKTSASRHLRINTFWQWMEKRSFSKLWFNWTNWFAKWFTVPKRSKRHTLVTPAGQNCVNAIKTRPKHGWKHILQTNCKCLKSSNAIKFECTICVILLHFGELG